ncbi:unnamed protein product [Symbiodinium natans]|uniref:Uncharacterized protein n=1 Tax=Symbiodinium natans TaxID=878477 RepID=A0A812U7W8_9DINO|nr:unnamed protein product [Symbiodinium natans]
MHRTGWQHDKISSKGDKVRLKPLLTYVNLGEADPEDDGEEQEAEKEASQRSLKIHDEAVAEQAAPHGPDKEAEATDIPDQDTEAPAEPKAKQASDSECHLFTLWEYPKGAPTYVRLNIESWRRHSHGRCGEPIFLNERNLRDWIPDLPEEYFKLPYQACKSDVVRYAVIYHHGGIYMDTDFLVVQDLDPVIDVLNLDLVSYSGSNTAGKECPASFSSNFLGGRKGSRFHKEVYDAQIEKMKNYCPLSQKGSLVNGKEQFCCFEEKDVKCDVPWAAIGEGVSHQVLKRMNAGQDRITSHCFAGDDSFVPHDMEGVLLHAPLLEDAKRRFGRQGVQKPFDRIAYHLFNSMTSLQSWSCKRLSSNSTLVSALYRRSFTTGAGSQIVTGLEASEFLRQNSDFREHSRPLVGGSEVPCTRFDQFANLAKMLPPPSGKADSSKCKIFTIAYPDTDGAPLAFHLNVNSWHRHTQDVCDEPILINDTNVKQYIPDLPKEYFRLPGTQEKLDLIRHGLIYHHGGMVLQWDVVFLQDLSRVVEKIAENDLVSSEERKQGEAFTCSDSWQILFTAGKRGSLLHGAIWQEAKDAVLNHCPLSDQAKEKLCCFDASRNCHVPGGALSEISMKTKKEFEGDDQVFSSYCYAEGESFRPALFQQILDHTPLAAPGRKRFRDEHHREIEDTLALFIPLSMTQDLKCQDLFDRTKVIGTVYGKSFGVFDGSEENQHCKRPSAVRSIAESLPTPAGAESDDMCRIFSLELPETPVAAQINFASWRQHMPPCAETVLISDANVRQWLPDIPEDYFQLPGPEEKLDFLRHGLLFHHGGIVMRRDVVAAQSLETTMTLASLVDLLSSAEENGGGSACGGSFQGSLMMGGKKGSAYHGVAWTLAKRAISQHCPPEDRSKEIICCFDGPEQCHIPGGSLGDSHSSRVKRMFEVAGLSLDSHCLAGQDSIRPAYFQFVLDHKRKLADASEYFTTNRHMQLLNRTAFYIPLADAKRACPDFFEMQTVVGAVYAKSFGHSDDGFCPL